MIARGKSPLPHFTRRLALSTALSLAALTAVLAPGAAQAYGRWEHGWHGDRLGWWWVDAGVWTWYAAGYPYGPYYPGYPYGYAPPYYYAPPVQAPVVTNIPAPPQSWYYCEAAKGYYPQVPNCPTGWRSVPAAPPVAPAAPAPAQ
jgi:hypothetical protein